MPRITRTEVINPHALSAEQRRQLTEALYAVHQQIFDGVEKEAFSQYVVESKAEHTWIQVHRNEAGAIVGYFALHVFERQLAGQPCAVFRAEAGSLRAYRGCSITVRFGLKRLLGYMLRNPGRKAYYLGSLVHPSSYTLLAHHFGTIWPQRGQSTPPELQAFMEKLAGEFGLERVDPERPLVRRVGWKTRETVEERDHWRRCGKPAAHFFLDTNPGYAEGHGLLTMVPLSAANVMRLALAVGQRKLRQPTETLRSLARRLPGTSRLWRAEVIRLLRTAPLLSHLGTRALKALAEQAEQLVIPAGQYVFRQGDSNDELYLLARGAAYVLREGPEDKVVDVLGSGAVFGEISILSGERRSASIRTATVSTVVRIPRAALVPVLEAYASVRQEVWRTFAERRFDDLARESTLYAPLSRKERLAWLRQGEHRELAGNEALSIPSGTSLFVLAGAVELQQAKSWSSTRGSTLMKAQDSLKVVARESAQLILLPASGG
ncbi:Crp/Fnr family transcriptional regulator [Hyalangium versicolor]|uniref:Crp/Fnr family transcriptional regulator n=1 Tax=Hyalangium versicolor TaxID=2861190 RepID=UPI001CCB6D02|nr:cyclic nucleotide-binding domain-containing protein [Hyalangium versicolor]